jgi:acyl-CoA thioester hydrolase
VTHTPAGAPYEYRMVAPDSDVDENCHISNIAYVRWVQEATRAHSDAIGWTKERYQETGCFFLIRSHELQYLRPAEGGDPIRCVTWVDEFHPASALRVTKIMRGDQELVHARTLWVFVSIEGNRPKRIPKEVVTAFSTPVKPAE